MTKPAFGHNAPHNEDVLRRLGEKEQSGSYLAECRQQIGYSIEQTSAATKIRQPYLEAIEAGDFQQLPNLAFAVGYARSYAVFLGVDVIEVAKRIKSEIVAANALNEASEGAGRLRVKPGLVIAAIVSAVVISAFFFAGFATGQGTQNNNDAATAAIEEIAIAKLVSAPEPSFPNGCGSAHGVSEQVSVSFDVGLNGRAKNIRAESSTNSCFETAAVRTVSQWVFTPRLLNGRASVETGNTAIIEFVG